MLVLMNVIVLLSGPIQFCMAEEEKLRELNAQVKTAAAMTTLTAKASVSRLVRQFSSRGLAPTSAHGNISSTAAQ